MVDFIPIKTVPNSEYVEISGEGWKIIVVKLKDSSTLDIHLYQDRNALMVSLSKDQIAILQDALSR